MSSNQEHDIEQTPESVKKVMRELHMRIGLQSLVATCGYDEEVAGWRKNPETNELLNVQTEFGIKVALIHSEVSEALEAHRKNKMDEHLPHRWGVEVEFADAIIRIASLAQWMGLDLSGAIIEKLEYNRQRSDHKLENRAKEGGKKF